MKLQQDKQDNNGQMAALREIGTHSQDAVLIVDRMEATVTFANTAASNLMGINTGDGVAKIGGMIDSVVTTDQEYVKNKYVGIRDQPATTNIEFRLVGSNGNTVWLSCDAYLVDDKRFVYVIARDITKPKQHEDYLVEYGAKKNTLLDTLTHQLSGSLMLMNNLSLKAGRLNVISDHPALEEFISLVHNNSRRCIDIIDELLKMEHTESPGIHVKFSRVDAVKIVNFIFEELKKSGHDRSILFETSDPAMFVTTDEVKLLQIVNNFASNAIKFTRENGEIKISMRETPFSVVIAVSDTGIGIPEGLQPFLFEKHGPARRTGLKGEKSMGLGLPICNHLTNLIGGRLWVESKEGAGSTFFLELPKD